MARPQKQTVDYFPHYCNHKKTMYILEQRYGNNGYAFWFKLLETLADTDKHYLDLNDETAWEFLQAKTHLEADLCTQILELLSKLDAIDPELWKCRVVWSQNFVDGISDAYRKRVHLLPGRPSFFLRKPPKTEQSPDGNGESIVKESKVKKNIYIPIKEFPNIKITQEEHQKLISLFGEEGTRDRIENLSLYIASKGDKYKSHYATILSWDKRDKKEGKGGKGNLPRVYKTPEEHLQDHWAKSRTD